MSAISIAQLPVCSTIYFRARNAYEEALISYELQDYTTAYENLVQALPKGWPETYFLLAECYRMGLGTDIDFDKAADLYLISAKFQNAEAMFQLALASFSGNGVGKNEIEAREWLEKATALEHPAAAGILNALDFKSLFMTAKFRNSHTP